MNTPIGSMANPTLKPLLFYTCVTPQIGNQCEEGFTLDQAGIEEQLDFIVGFLDRFPEDLKQARPSASA